MDVDLNKVSRVLLPDTWYAVEVGSFQIDEPRITRNSDRRLISSLRSEGWFRFQSDTIFVTGPLSSISAFEMKD